MILELHRVYIVQNRYTIFLIRPIELTKEGYYECLKSQNISQIQSFGIYDSIWKYPHIKITKWPDHGCDHYWCIMSEDVAKRRQFMISDYHPQYCDDKGSVIRMDDVQFEREYSLWKIGV